MIEIQNLKKSYGNLQVLNGINLTIQTGEIFGIVGKSGEGKTTLLNCLSLLEKSDSGFIMLDGKSISGGTPKTIREYQKNLGMIFQHFSLLERRNVYKNIALPMSCWGYTKKDIDEKVRSLCKIVGIEEKMFSMPKTLSGGQRQRVVIARALALNPRLLLCDEATSALDPQSTKSILELLRDINEKLHLTIIIVTHEMDVVRKICHRVAIIEDGSISVCGDTQEVFLSQPPALKRLLGTNDLPIQADGITVKLIFRNNGDDDFFIPEMSRQLTSKFSIISSKQEEFRDTLITTALLHFSSNDWNEAEAYLIEKKVNWEVIKR